MIPSTCDLILPNLCAEILTALKRYIRKKKNNQLGFKIPTTLPTRPLGKSSGGNTIWAAESIASAHVVLLEIGFRPAILM
jgi:hypothetical protein